LNVAAAAVEVVTVTDVPGKSVCPERCSAAEAPATKPVPMIVSLTEPVLGADEGETDTTVGDDAEDTPARVATRSKASRNVPAAFHPGLRIRSPLPLKVFTLTEETLDGSNSRQKRQTREAQGLRANADLARGGP